MKVLFRVFFLLLCVLIAVMLFKTFTFKSKQIKGIEVIKPIEIPKSAISNFSQLIQQATISKESNLDSLSFKTQDSLIQSFYPLIHKRLQRKTYNDYSLVYKWKGKDPSLKPILLLGHLDVVPIEEEDLASWTEAPFSGAVKNGKIWGRGSLDDKINVVGSLEAISLLLEEEFLPARDIYLAFGHDEEIGGEKGAKTIANSFLQESIEFEFVLDEGLVILKEALAGLDKPLAMIGIAEKGFTSLQLEVNLNEGGHSAMPGNVTAIGLLSGAINRLSEKQFPAKIDGAAKGLFSYAGPEMNFFYKTLFANLWLTKGLLKAQLLKDPTSAALVRTTTAPTLINSGVKDNVMPAKASASINFRILPGEDINSVVQRVKEVIAEPLIEVKVNEQFSSNPSGVSPTDSFGYRVLQKTTQEIIPDVVISPGLVIAATDSRHYSIVSKNIYRFTPVVIDRSDLKGIHGNNEHISIENFENTIRFYKQLIINSCQ